MEKIAVVKPCPVCEEGSLHYGIRDLEITRRGVSTAITEVAGWFCDHCEEIDFDEATDSRERFTEAGDQLVLLAREQVAQSLKQARKTLKMSQADAALIAGGGHNAFSRYETGAAQPVAAVVHLFALLRRHPELLAEVREMALASSASITRGSPAGLATGNAPAKATIEKAES